MNKYTFIRNYQARTAAGAIVTVPDQVWSDQTSYDGKSFPVIKQSGAKGRARLIGDLYGLGTPGVGEMILRID